MEGGAHGIAAFPIVVRRAGRGGLPRLGGGDGLSIGPLGIGERAARLGDRQRDRHALRHGCGIPKHRSRLRPGLSRGWAHLAAARGRVHPGGRTQRRARTDGASHLRRCGDGHRSRRRAPGERLRRGSVVRGHECARARPGALRRRRPRGVAARLRGDPAAGRARRPRDPAFRLVGGAGRRRRGLRQPVHPASPGVLATVERSDLSVPGHHLRGAATVHPVGPRPDAGTLGDAGIQSGHVRVASAGGHRSAADPDAGVPAGRVLRRRHASDERRRPALPVVPMLRSHLLQGRIERGHVHRERRSRRAAGRAADRRRAGSDGGAPRRRARDRPRRRGGGRSLRRARSSGRDGRPHDPWLGSAGVRFEGRAGDGPSRPDRWGRRLRGRSRRRHLGGARRVRLVSGACCRAGRGDRGNDHLDRRRRCRLGGGVRLSARTPPSHRPGDRGVAVGACSLRRGVGVGAQSFRGRGRGVGGHPTPAARGLPVPVDAGARGRHPHRPAGALRAPTGPFPRLRRHVVMARGAPAAVLPRADVALPRRRHPHALGLGSCAGDGGVAADHRGGQGEGVRRQPGPGAGRARRRGGERLRLSPDDGHPIPRGGVHRRSGDDVRSPARRSRDLRLGRVLERCVLRRSAADPPRPAVDAARGRRRARRRGQRQAGWLRTRSRWGSSACRSPRSGPRARSPARRPTHGRSS